MSDNSRRDSPVSFATIVGLCESFAGDTSEASLVTLDSYLGGVGENIQPVLLRNLLAIEIRNCRNSGQQPQAQEYIQRLPRFADLIRQAFLDTVDSLASPRPKIATLKRPAVSRLGDYRLLGEPGRGGMGIVYEAVHLQHGNHVTLKTLPIVDGAALHRFKREFRSLADVNHPHLIGSNRCRTRNADVVFKVGA